MFKDNFLSDTRAGVGWMVRSHWPYFIVLFLLAFAIRVHQLNKIPIWDLIPTDDREMGAIAMSLAQTGQFADPYKIPTGPTAHLPPIYPFIVSVIYRMFGLTATAGYVSLLFITITASLLYALLPWFSDQFGLSRHAGFIGGLAGALRVEWHGHGEYLTGIFLGLLLVAFLRRWNNVRVSWDSSLLLGLGMGAAFHLQPALLPVMLACMAFELWWRTGQRRWTTLSVMTLGIVLICFPWAWRNYRTFNALIFVRSNFGLEMRMGNHEGAAATMEEMDFLHIHRHPTQISSEARYLREVGEIEYMRGAGREALDWIETHPAAFVWLTSQRIANLWLGPLHTFAPPADVLLLTILSFLGAWHTFPRLTLPQRAALVIPLATYPIIYYITAYMPRYRVPIDWILLILAGALVWSWIRPRSSRLDGPELTAI